MKNYIKSILLLTCVIATMSLMTSCSQTDANHDMGEMPHIEYARVCAPLASDSLLTGASMGSRIAFIGQNLGDVREMWFNDQKALLNPDFVTSSSIIVDVPNIIPTDVTDSVKLITSTGLVYKYPFKTIVPAPSITGISCEYGNPGDVLTITGDYFLNPTVTFPNGLKAEIVSFTKTAINVKVPTGATEGFITVTSIYGTGKSTFKFLDTRGLITNFDDGYVNSWGLGAISNTDGVSGNYLHLVDASDAAWAWKNSLMYSYWASEPTSHGNVPIATGDITKLVLKFECKVNTWSDVPMLIWFSKYNAGKGISPDDSYAQCHWKPYSVNGVKSTYTSGGWITVSIPLTDFKYDKAESKTDMTMGDISQYTDFNVMLFGAADAANPVDICMDNFRIVSK
jgi:hypothetical protein